MADLAQLEEQIVSLSLLEAAALVKKLEERLGVSAAAAAPVAAAGGAGAAAAPVVEEKTEFQFKLGIVDGKLLTAEEVKALATMPGKEELFSKLLFLINAPAQRLATVINATGRDLAVVLGQGVEKEKFAAEAAA